MAIGDIIQKARANGVTDDELLDYLTRKQPDYTDRIRLAQNSGYNASEILNSMSKSSPSQLGRGVGQLIQSGLNTALHSNERTEFYKQEHAREREEEGLVPTFMRGLRRSATGRYLMEQEPEEKRLEREQFGPEPTTLESAVAGLGQYGGDIPEMVVGQAVGGPLGGLAGAAIGGAGGALVGGAGGLITGGLPGAAVGALSGAVTGGAGGSIVGSTLGRGAGAMAVPEAMKQIRDLYEEAKKQKKDLTWGDYLELIYEGTVNPEVAKQAGLGSVLGLVTPAFNILAKTKVIAPFLKNPKVAEKVVTWGSLAGEGGVLVADGAFEKGELPSSADIADVAAQLLAIKAANGSWTQVKKLYGLTKAQFTRGVQQVPKQTQANILNAPINSSEFRIAMQQVTEASKKQVKAIEKQGAEQAEQAQKTAILKAKEVKSTEKLAISADEARLEAVNDKIADLSTKGKLTPEEQASLDTLKKEKTAATQLIREHAHETSQAEKQKVRESVSQAKRSPETRTTLKKEAISDLETIKQKSAEEIAPIKEELAGINKKIDKLQSKKTPTPEEKQALNQAKDRKRALTKQIGELQNKYTAQYRAELKKGLREKQRIKREASEQAELARLASREKQKIAAKEGLVTYKEGDINPLSAHPDRLVTVRYVPRQPSDAGKTSSQVIRQHYGDIEEPGYLKRGATIAYNAIRHPIESYRKLYRGLYDKAKILETIAKQTGDTELRASYDRTKRAEALVEYDILYGEVDPTSREKLSDQSLKAIVKDALPSDYGIEGKDRGALSDYLVAASSIDRTNLGQENPIPTADAENIQREMPFFRKVAEKLWEFQDRALKHALKVGLITPEGYTAMKQMYKAYVPLYRVQGDFDIESGARPKSGEKAFNPLQRAIGSLKQIADPLNSIIKNTRALNKAIANNNFANQLRRNLQQMGFKVQKADAPELPGARELGNENFEKALHNSGGWFSPDAFSNGEHTIYGYENGKRWKIEGVPSEVMSLFRAPYQAGRFLEALGGLKKFFSKGLTVYNPIGSTLIGVRDMMNTSVASRGPLGVATYYAEFMQALASVLKKDARFQDYVKSGFYTHTYRGMNKTPFEESITDIFGAAKDTSDPALRNRALQVLAGGGNMIRKLGRMMESYSEGWADAGRIAWLESEIKRPEYDGLSRSEAYKKATAVGNDRLLQFDRQGGWVLPQILSKTLPFYNTAMQDTATLARLVKSGGPAFYANAAISITLPALVSHLSVMNDDRYKRLKDYVKQRNYAVKPYFGLWDNGTDDLWLFPKEWSYGYLFGTTAEMFIDYIVDKEGEQSAWDAVMQWAQGLAEENNPVQVIWGGPRQQVPKKLERVSAAEQYTPNTTGFAKKVGEIFNVSPIYVDSAISYLGSPLAKNLLHLADELMFYTDIKDDRRPEGRNFASFFLSRFYRSGADLGSSYLMKFYELAEKADTKVNDFNLARKRGEEAKADKLEDAGLYRTQKARKLISAIYQEADEIQQAPISEISAAEKERLLRELAKEMDELAKDFVKDMKEAGV